jgi:ribosome-associated toxin RatA of RatAB toxin-antitoxin module
VESVQTVRKVIVQTETEIFINADPMTVYRFGSATDRWPEILPHYRWVHVLEEKGNSRLVEMAARRDFKIAQWPVRWWAIQTNYPDEPRIAFKHIRGITVGMEVEWNFTPTETGVRVAINHDLNLRWPIIGGIVANNIIGPIFIDYIAGKTLARIKELSETHEPAMAGAHS